MPSSFTVTAAFGVEDTVGECDPVARGGCNPKPFAQRVSEPIAHAVAAFRAALSLRQRHAGGTGVRLRRDEKRIAPFGVSEVRCRLARDRGGEQSLAPSPSQAGPDGA